MLKFFSMRNLWRWIWVGFIIITASLFARQEKIKFEHISIEQGLSQSSVLCILQDRQGFMWFGTDGGLNKYDGYNFTVYKQDPENPHSLSSSTIIVLYEDDSGVLWIGTYDGLNKFDREKETFTHYQHDPGNPNSLSENFVWSLYEDRAGVLWIGTDGGGLNKFDREKETFTHYKHDPGNPGSLGDDIVLSINEDRTGVLWIGTNGGGLNKFDREKETFTRYQHNPGNPNSLSHKLVWSLCEDRAGVLWVGTHGGLNKFDREKETFTHYQHDPGDPNSLSDDVILSLYADRAGVLWIGTNGGGLNKFDREKETFTHYQHDPAKPNSLSTNRVRSICQDRAGALWIGLDGGGLNKFDRKKEAFACYQHDFRNPNSLSSNLVRSLYEDHAGVLWIGTDSGLNKLDREEEIFTHYLHDPGDPNSLSSNRVRSICEDRTGVLWIGTNGGGLNKLDREKGIFTHYLHDPGDPNSISGNLVWSLHEGHSGVLWIGTYIGGLNKFDREKGTFTHYLHDPGDPNSLSDNLIRVLYEDRAGMLWIGTDKGLNKFDREKETFTRYQHNPRKSNSLSGNRVRSICEDRTGMLWIGTNGGGLNRFDREKGNFTHYNLREGLPDDVIYGILEDNLGNLWLSTNNGLSKFNTQTMQFRNYDAGDGLQSKEFNGGASYESRRTGEMFFGGVNGFNVFHPDSVRDNPYIPPIVITAFRRYNADGIAIIEKGIVAREEIQVPYNDNILVFEFTALSYRNTFKNQYAYNLEGFHDQWIYLGSKREVTFTNLDPGEYTLHVKGSNNDGVWNEEGTALKITILPPWWETWWAYTLYVLFAFGLLYGIRRFELNRQRLKHEWELEHLEREKIQEVDRLKSRFFANISHEFRTPLTLIRGPVQQLLSGEFTGNLNRQYRMILRNCNRLLRLINQLLDLSKFESGNMTLQVRPENIVQLTRQLTMAFESLASVRDIQVKFAAPERSITAYIDREKYEKIIINLLSNAMKFTHQGGRVRVMVSSCRGVLQYTPTENFVEIRISDSGPGIPVKHLPHIFERFYQADDSAVREHSGTGIGLALTKELVELHHGEIEVESEPGKGTTFIIRLPLGKTHLQENEIAAHEKTAGAKHPRQKMPNIEFPISNFEDRQAGIAHSPNPPITESLNQSITKSLNQSITKSLNHQILIVEDNPDMRAYIHNSLKVSYRILEAEEGTAGFKTALKAAPDLIISDVMMPNMDGYQFCEKIKSDPRTSHIPVILLTAKASRDSKLEGLETGADDYLTKPFDAEELQLRIKNLIEQRRRLRERFQRELRVEPQDITVTPADEKFLYRAMEIVEQNLSSSEFDTAVFSREIGLGRSQLNVKLRALTGCSTREFIRTLRLKRAAQLLQQRFGNVAEVAYQVGFNSLSHFSKAFKEQFGMLPSEYRTEQRGEKIS